MSDKYIIVDDLTFIIVDKDDDFDDGKTYRLKIGNIMEKYTQLPFTMIIKENELGFRNIYLEDFTEDMLEEVHDV
tara:strand:- start:765 stop:989 length:225 start_codon:yes stop_codon:yes gene_type:complete